METEREIRRHWGKRGRGREKQGRRERHTDRGRRERERERKSETPNSPGRDLVSLRAEKNLPCLKYAGKHWSREGATKCWPRSELRPQKWALWGWWGLLLVQSLPGVAGR